MSPTNNFSNISHSEETISEADFSGVSELQLQAWELLEFTNVRKLLANRTRFFMSRQMALATRPTFDIEVVERLQNETAKHP